VVIVDEVWAERYFKGLLKKRGYKIRQSRRFFISKAVLKIITSLYY